MFSILMMIDNEPGSDLNYEIRITYTINTHVRRPRDDFICDRNLSASVRWRHSVGRSGLVSFSVRNNSYGQLASIELRSSPKSPFRYRTNPVSHTGFSALGYGLFCTLQFEEKKNLICDCRWLLKESVPCLYSRPILPKSKVKTLKKVKKR